MTIQWTLVATFLYLELAFIGLLLLPFISPKVWQYVFYSRFCRIVADKANIYFTVFIIVLSFFLLDSIREMLNYSSKTSVDLGQELQINLKLFRSQRNYYISGFAVFLWLVIRRLVMLVLCEADLLSENESAMKRAQNATETLEKIYKKRGEVAKETSIITQSYIVKAEKVNKTVEEARHELEITTKAIEEAKERALAVTKEYENLLEQHTALLNKSVKTENKNQRSEDREASSNEEDVSDDNLN